MARFLRFLFSLVSWLLLVVFPTIATAMAMIRFTSNKPGAPAHLRRWIKYWSITIPLILFSKVVGFAVAYWAMRLWILFRIVNDNLVDGNGNGAGSRRLAELVTFVKTEGPKLPSRLFAQVGDAINAFDTAIASTNQTNSNSTPFITGTQQREAAVGEVVTVTPFTAPLTGGPSDKPFTRTSSFESDTASLVAAVEARRRQLEAELAALPARQPSQTVEVFPEIGLNQKSE